MQNRSAHAGAGANAILVYLSLAVATMLVGLVLRLAPLGLPYWLTKWGGSVLWAAMVYWLLAMLMPDSRVWAPASLAAGIAMAVEMLRLYHSPGLDAFRLTLAGILLLGRVFSVWHILAYSAAIAAAARVDWALFKRGRG